MIIRDGASGFGMSNVTGETASGSIVLYKPGAAQRLKVMWEACNIPSNIAQGILKFSGSGSRVASQVTNAVRLLVSAGNIASGEFRLYGIRK